MPLCPAIDDRFKLATKHTSVAQEVLAGVLGWQTVVQSLAFCKWRFIDVWSGSWTGTCSTIAWSSEISHSHRAPWRGRMIYNNYSRFGTGLPTAISARQRYLCRSEVPISVSTRLTRQQFLQIHGADHQSLDTQFCRPSLVGNGCESERVVSPAKLSVGTERGKQFGQVHAEYMLHRIEEVNWVIRISRA